MSLPTNIYLHKAQHLSIKEPTALWRESHLAGNRSTKAMMAATFTSSAGRILVSKLTFSAAQALGGKGRGM